MTPSPRPHSDNRQVGTQQKALRINLDPTKYGAFAEIGAGQEVVRWFFQVGGAAGTIAKSMSAYDMTVSDAIYGPCPRYVSRERLQTMLDHEFDLLVERLGPQRGDRTEFFAFADTVAAQSWQGTAECHGWMGIRFQTFPRTEPSEIVLHVRMLDRDNVAQQEALGIVGVNLIHAALYHPDDTYAILRSLLDSLTADRIEVDMIKFTGPAFPDIDHRLVALKLVQLELANAALFRADGEVLQPSEALRKRPILVERGSFRPVTHVNVDMLECARQQFEQVCAADPDDDGKGVVTLFEITMRNLLARGEIDYDDFLARADMIAATGATVLISDYFEYYRLAGYLRRYTRRPIALAMGIPSLRDLFEEKYYEELEGGILESFGRLFKNGLKLYVYPYLDQATHQLTTVAKLKVAPHLQSLYEHLVENGCIEGLDFYDRDYLHIFSREVIRRIEAKDPSWEGMVPDAVARLIKERGLLGYEPGC
ncbi:MAG: TonB-dependent receptor [Armatimonadota bacterium]